MSHQNTLFIGKVLHSFATLDSSNRYAQELLAKSSPAEGTVISAGHQTAGRGQIGSSWHSSPDKNVLMSIILKPNWLMARQQFLLSQAVALGVAWAVEAISGLAAVVKWPNDVYMQGQKVAGILIQNSLSGQFLQWSVVGIGLNVNEHDFPAELPLASSLSLLTGQRYALDEVLQFVCAGVEAQYLQLKSQPELVRLAYLRNLYRYQEWGWYERCADGLQFEAFLDGLTPEGHLLLTDRQGDTASFALKEVKFML